MKKALIILIILFSLCSNCFADKVQKCISFTLNINEKSMDVEDISEKINKYLDLGWTVVTMTPITKTSYGDKVRTQYVLVVFELEF